MSIFSRFRGDEVERQIKRLGLGHKPHEVLDAMSALRDIGESAVLPLIQVLLDRSEPDILRRRVADTLSWIKDDRATEPLITALSDNNERVRWSALKALEKLSERRAIPALQQLADGDEGAF